jgi:Mg2+ and Co2+ transporter CorA
MHYIITYDKSGVKQQKQMSKTDLENGYQIWLDLENPTLEEISNIQEIFDMMLIF